MEKISTWNAVGSLVNRSTSTRLYSSSSAMTRSGLPITQPKIF